jgi:hypothetical protein
MNILNVFDHSEKKQNIEYFVHLVHVALADNIITKDELDLLHRLGQRLGFTDPEIDNLIEETEKSGYTPPFELEKRFEQVYNIVKMTLADGVIDNKEMRLASNFASKSGFKENEIPRLLVLLISGIREGQNEDDLFEVYKKQRKS